MADFTEFEQRDAYFYGNPVMATKKGVNSCSLPRCAKADKRATGRGSAGVDGGAR